nr:MAG TPA: hypothetical protein [Caudoviricetes sp.]
MSSCIKIGVNPRDPYIIAVWLSHLLKVEGTVFLSSNHYLFEILFDFSYVYKPKDNVQEHTRSPLYS